MSTSQQAVRAALALVFSARASVRSLPAAEREDPAAMLRAVHGAVDGDLWDEVPFAAMRELLVCCAEAAWTGGITAVPQSIESADAALMLRLTGEYLAEGGFRAPEGHGALLIIGDRSGHHRRARDVACVLLVLAILAGPAQPASLPRPAE
jgi:hypothetical protein